MKKQFKALILAVFAVLVFCNIPSDAYAAEKWDRFKGDGVASVDTSVVYGDADYSIKIEHNNGYYCSYVAKTFSVKPNTHYRASVMAKNVGYEPKPNGAEGGAKLGIPTGYLPGTPCYSGSEWKKLSFDFYTGENETSYEIAMWNGIWGGDCKGTAYFSDFHLEECSDEQTNEWNVMLVVFENVKAPVKIDGKKTTFKGTLTDSDASFIAGIVRNIYTSIPTLSDNRWKISAVDTYVVDAPITELAQYGDTNYCIDYNSPCVSEQLDMIIDDAFKESGRTYQQLIAVANLDGKISDMWLGLGGGDYNGIRTALVKYSPQLKWAFQDDLSDNYHETAFVHEMLHGIENLTRGVDPDSFVKFHANVDEYKNSYTDLTHQKGWGSWGAYHSDYMRAATPDGRGVNEKAYLVSDSYHNKLVYGDPDTYITPRKTDIQSLEVKGISAKTYTGSAIKPAVTIMDGDYKLVKGTDYTLSYLNNKSTGKACAIITGIGKYAGEYAETFNIKPKTPSVTAVKSGSQYKLTWKKVTGATKVQIYVCPKGSSSYKLAKTVKGSSTSATVTAAKGSKIKVRAYKMMYPQKYYSSYSKEISCK